MTEKEQAERAMDTIKYNLTPGIHTSGTCRICHKNGARGAGQCAHCAEKDLAEVIGGALASKYHILCAQYMRAKGEIGERLEVLDD